MHKTAATDIVIFGGGIAGLWLLHRLRQIGFSTILLESNALGGGQTNKSQGIIHGGMKYALQGVLTKEAQAISEMPPFWQYCLEGRGEIDLSNVPVLSPKQYLWAPHKFTSKLTGFLAGAALASKVQALAKEHYPSIFHQPHFKGEVFSLNEMVIDVPALVRELVKLNPDAVYKIEPLCEEAFQFDAQEQLKQITVYMAGQAIDIRAKHFIFTAGAGNDLIIKKLKQPTLAMQKRPLHMVMMKAADIQPLYAHCLGLGSKPRLTITTHYLQNGEAIWYLGGGLAEEGVTRDSAAQIQAARKEVQTLFPWIDLTKAEFATFRIDRAEAMQGSGAKPDHAYLKAVNNVLIGWPTKLALAPRLAASIITHLQQIKAFPEYNDVRDLRAWPMPPLAIPIWEELFCNIVA